MLGTHPHQAVDLGHVLAYAVARDDGIPARRLDEAGEHVDGGGLAGSVGPVRVCVCVRQGREAVYACMQTPKTQGGKAR